MLTIQKTSGKDFVILNLTDPQMNNAEWAPGHSAYKILKYTTEQLIEKVRPDLITVSGDISWGADHYDSYRNFAEFMESFGVPLAPVWGNHDDEDGADVVEEVADLYLTYPHCLYEKGDPKLGNGNYVITVREGEKIVSALFMMDTHAKNNRVLLDKKCVETPLPSYASLTFFQLVWYREQAEILKKLGCTDSALIVHIPLYCYREAFFDATEEEFREPGKVSIADSYQGIGWKDAYKSTCFGVNREGIASSNYDDGVLEVLLDCALTSHVIAGHEHINNFSIPYRGIRLTYATKIGPGCYWNPDLNGGTVLTVDGNGIRELHHEYVDVSHLL